MADFYKAYSITMAHEGGYSNDPDDAGGETYKGVARNFNPNWVGWEIIDSYKGSETFEEDLKADTELNQKVKEFYKQNYWDVNRLDGCTSQLIANEMFDTGVNLGISRAAKFLQTSLNFLNKNASLFEDLDVDAKIGPRTFNALNTILDRGEENLLYKFLNVLQANHYMEYMNKTPTQEKYARGWFNRVNFVK